MEVPSPLKGEDFIVPSNPRATLPQRHKKRLNHFFKYKKTEDALGFFVFRISILNPIFTQNLIKSEPLNKMPFQPKTTSEYSGIF